MSEMANRTNRVCLGVTLIRPPQTLINVCLSYRLSRKPSQVPASLENHEGQIILKIFPNEKVLETNLVPSLYIFSFSLKKILLVGLVLVASFMKCSIALDRHIVSIVCSLPILEINQCNSK